MKPPQQLMEITEIKSFYQNISAKIPTKLKNQIQGNIVSNNLTNFLNFFAELNFVALLNKHDVAFIYEQQDGIDFEFGDYVVSFKNLTEKGHIVKEKQDIENILKESGEKTASKNFEYKNTKAEVTSGTDGGYRRIMTGSFSNGEAPKDDVIEKQKILENLAKLEKVGTSKKKILFLFAQDETADWEVEEIYLWYLDLPLHAHDLIKPETYTSWFKASKNKSVEAIIFARPVINGIYKLVWYNEVSPKIYTRNKDVKEYFDTLFSVGAIPAVL
ncbi:MAG: hypothetical protein WCJ59_02365 [bacterium]